MQRELVKSRDSQAGLEVELVRLEEVEQHLQAKGEAETKMKEEMERL